MISKYFPKTSELKIRIIYFGSLVEILVLAHKPCRGIIQLELSIWRYSVLVSISYIRGTLEIIFICWVKRLVQKMKNWAEKFDLLKINNTRVLIENTAQIHWQWSCGVALNDASTNEQSSLANPSSTTWYAMLGYSQMKHHRVWITTNTNLFTGLVSVWLYGHSLFHTLCALTLKESDLRLFWWTPGATLVSPPPRFTGID